MATDISGWISFTPPPQTKPNARKETFCLDTGTLLYNEGAFSLASCTARDTEPLVVLIDTARQPEKSSIFFNLRRKHFSANYISPVATNSVGLCCRDCRVVSPSETGGRKSLMRLRLVGISFRVWPLTSSGR